MADFNSITMVGRLTRDPELTYIADQTPMCKFGLASNHKSKGKEDVCFVECVCFDKTAEVVQKYTAKGRLVLISGRLRFETWQGKDGQKHSKHSITVYNTQFLDSNKQQAAPQQADPQQHPKQYQQPQPAPQQDAVDYPADDIPF